MATLDEILKLGDAFQASVQKLQTSRAIADATEAIDQIKSSEMSVIQKNAAMKDAGNKLALRLAGLGTPATTIQTAFAAIAPKELNTLEDIEMEAATTGDQQLKDIAATKRRQIAEARKAEKEENLAVQKDLKAQEFKYAKTLKEMDIKADKDKVASEGGKAQSAIQVERAKRIDFVREGFQAFKAMRDSYNKNWIGRPDFLGDNDYTAAAKELKRSLLRMESGGAITKDEVSEYESLFPSARDSESAKKAKFQRLEAKLQGRLETLGMSKEDVVGLSTTGVMQLPEGNNTSANPLVYE